MRISLPAVIGKNIIPGRTPGGFWPPMPKNTSEYIDPRKLPPKPGGDHFEMREACNRILEGRARR